jgi:hypothetical protein
MTDNAKRHFLNIVGLVLIVLYIAVQVLLVLYAAAVIFVSVWR